ncbi:hypothetical protein [Spirosoma endbachense]|uniref:Uncharacterized protein n=1 Tax=Spirosoma endbachense TaxID=2666025 RepID=A0A6P1VP67_9BACT|nr:hypothetical protein [Spirosoma endbachense]QHV94505.1 hypothetical protein GJR95_05525 [Spirosoma endbachense]
MNQLLIALFLFLNLRIATAQSGLADTQAYDYLQDERARPRKPQNGMDKPPVDSLKKAEQILLDALTYDHRPNVQEVAKGSSSLFYRKSDISFDLALVQAKRGNNEAAAQTLIYPLTGKFASAYASYIAEMNEFEGV